MQSVSRAEIRVNPTREFRSGWTVTGSPAAPIVDDCPGDLMTAFLLLPVLLACLAAVAGFGCLLWLAGSLFC